MIAISSLLFLKKDVKVIGLDLTFSELSLTFGISAIEQLMGSTYFSTFYFLVSIIFALILFLSEIIVDSFLLRFLESILAISSFDCLFSSSFRFYSSSFTFSFSSLDISFAFIFSWCSISFYLALISLYLYFSSNFCLFSSSSLRRITSFSYSLFCFSLSFLNSRWFSSSSLMSSRSIFSFSFSCRSIAAASSILAWARRISSKMGSIRYLAKSTNY